MYSINPLLKNNKQQSKKRSKHLNKKSKSLKKVSKSLKKGSKSLKKGSKSLKKGSKSLKKGRINLNKGSKSLKKMKGGDESPIKNIFYIWLGDTDKCGLTEENIKSWRDGFPEARIIILVIEEKISEFSEHFGFLSKYNVELISPNEFLHPFMGNVAVQRAVDLLEKFIPFLMDGDKSLFNESFAYVSSIPIENAFDSAMKNKYYFNTEHKNYSNTRIKIAARLKDLLCFIGCIFMPNTLYLDIDTTFVKFNPEKITPHCTKLILPIINTGTNYQIDIYAILSLDTVEIEELIINNYVEIIADYLDAVPYYYLSFTTDDIFIPDEKYHIGIKYLKDQFDMMSSIILTYALHLFQYHIDLFPRITESMEELSNKLMLLNKNIMMFPDITLLDPRVTELYELIKLKGGSKLNDNDKMKQWVKFCNKIKENIDADNNIFNKIEETFSYMHKSQIEKIYTFMDYYPLVIFIYQFRKSINNTYLIYLIENITGTKGEVTRPIQTDAKEDMIQLKNWICQLLDENYENGLLDLWSLQDKYEFNIDESTRFTYLGKCEVLENPKGLKGRSVLCDNGIIDFYKKFNHSYYS